MSWDNRLLLFAAARRSAALDVFFRGVTWLGSLYILTPLAILVAAALLHGRRQREILLLVVGFGGAVLLAHLAKTLLDRPRPTLVEPLVALPADSSFPSAHTTQSTAFALSLALVIHRTIPEWWFAAAMLAVALVAAVALSRIYLRVHFPSDVLGGFLLGVVWVTLAHLLL